MAPSDLRPCPFCARVEPALAAVGDDRVQYFVVTCPECGATGPRATSDDPPGHAEHLWNQRFDALQ
ncbi:MAG: Lar family restriction alleviation protein [Vicinamibacterales bacterium]